MLPIFDAEGQLIAAAGRLLTESERLPKYVNSKETVLFKKKHVLFGAHIAREALLALCPVKKEDDERNFGTDEDDDYLDIDDDDC